jgi:hypothetical protein
MPEEVKERTLVTFVILTFALAMLAVKYAQQLERVLP